MVRQQPAQAVRVVLLLRTATAATTTAVSTAAAAADEMGRGLESPGTCRACAIEVCIIEVSIGLGFLYLSIYLHSISCRL